MKKFLAGCALAALSTSAAYAQETTSSIGGTVTSGGAPIAGATVKITHVPSGTVATTVTRTDGTFNAPGLRNGGPFSVEVSAAGYSSSKVTDIQTSVGQPFNLPVDLDKAGQEIVVTAAKVKGARTISEGPATVLTANQISKIASVNRDIRDLMRRDPFATLDTSSTPSRSVTFAGVNPRFNRFTVDGVPITDSFGLNPDALPSRRGPVPLDSIGQFETKVAPYDVREGFFEGGVVNAILKSGTNQFHGTGFYTYNSDKLTGDKTKPFTSLNGGGAPTGAAPQPHFTSKDFGATISGPIIKDRVFFMVSGERVRASLPLYNTTFTAGGIPIVNLSDATFSAITSASNTLYGVNPGGIATVNGDKDDRIVGKIDINITTGQRLSVTGFYTKDSIISLGNAAATTLATLSDDYLKPNRVVGGVVQLNSDWNSTFSTETRVRYKDYQSGQTPLVANTATATVCTDAANPGVLTNTTTSTTTGCTGGVASVVVGPPGSAQANVLHIKTFGASEVVRASFGEHTVRALFEYENSKNYDLFVNGALGTYYFDTLNAFNAKTAQGFTYANATTLNPNDAAAAFKYQTYTFGLQDDWRVNSELHVSAGLRYDLYGSSSTPPNNVNFTNRNGFSNQYFISGKGLLQPRVGFDYTPTRRLAFHGGVGLFGGGTPDVYVANSFSASGVQPANITQAQCPAALTNVSLTSIPASCNAAIQSATLSANGSTSAIDPHFKVPSQWRATLSASHDTDLGPLGDHWQFSANGLFSKTRDAIFYRDSRNIAISGANALTPDGRQRYYDVVANSANATVRGTCLVNSTTCNDTQGDYLLTNTSRGRTFIAVAQVNKRWNFGLELGASFTYQDARDLSAIESSIAGSNYNNTAYYDPNGGAYGHSDDEVRYQFKYNVSFEHAFFRDAKTRIDLFGETRIGSPYSFTFQDTTSSGTSRSTVFGTVGTNTHYLFYVPTGISDPKVIYNNAATAALIDQLISNGALAKYRGQVAPRNAFNSKWFTRIDLHIEQEIPTFLFHSKISVFADIENFTNLLNHKWGQQLRSSFPYYKTVTQVTCVAAGTNSCAQYLYTGYNPSNTVQDQLITLPSLYSIRVGARLTF